MYVECADQPCKISFTATNTQELIKDIPSLNAQLMGCPQQIPKGTGLVFANGDTQVDISMNAGGTQSFLVTISNGAVTGVKSGSGNCKQKISTTETDVDNVMSSTSVGQAIAYIIGQKKLKVQGCTILPKVRLFFVNPIVRLISRSQASQPPPTKPAPNCGNIGEQCNNRGCFSGICGAPNEQNAYGQWGYWNYRCLSQSEWASKCQGIGNTPAPWRCLTGPCG
jgi:hypothetical protein